MQNNGTSVLDRSEAARVSPLIEGDYWFDSEPGAVLIRMHVPLSPAQMVAVLYCETVACDDVEVWGQVAVVLAACGMAEIERRENDLNRELAEGREDAAFLAQVRARVAEVTGAKFPAARKPRMYRKVQRQDVPAGGAR